MRSKYKRKTKKNDLANFSVAKWNGENVILVLYPKLAQKNEAEIKEIVTHMITISQISEIQVFRDRQPVDIFGIEEKKTILRE